MKVQLVNPPWSRPGMYGVRAGSRWPHFEDDRHDYMPFPFLLAYAAAVLRPGTPVIVGHLRLVEILPTALISRRLLVIVYGREVEDLHPVVVLAGLVVEA